MKRHSATPSGSSEHGALLLVVLGLVLLLSSVAAVYATIVHRSLELEASLFPALRSRLAESDWTAEVVADLARDGDLAARILSGDATVLTSTTPRLVAIGQNVRRFISLRSGDAGERAPSWSALRRTLPRTECSEPSTISGRGASRHSCSISEAQTSLVIEGNLEGAGLRMIPTPDAALTVAVIGGIDIGRLEVPCPASGEITLVATGPVTIGGLALCDDAAVRLLLQSSASTVVISEVATVSPSSALCQAGAAEIPARVALQSALGSRISTLVPFPAGIAGCPLPRSASFWTRIKLVGEDS